MKKNKISLMEADEKSFEKAVKDSEAILKDLEPVFNDFEKLFKNLKPQIRFFVCDSAIGCILNSARLPSYLLTAISSKYWMLSQLPHIVRGQVLKKQEETSYVG